MNQTYRGVAVAVVAKVVLVEKFEWLYHTNSKNDNDSNKKAKDHNKANINDINDNDFRLMINLNWRRLYFPCNLV